MPLMRRTAAAILATAALCLALPWGVMVAMVAYSTVLNGNNAGAELRLGEMLNWAALFQIFWALRAGWLLYRNLRRRKFAQAS